MTTTPPPRRRKISSVVTVRRAQSERRYLSPWQSTHLAHTRVWQPLMGHPGHPPKGYHHHPPPPPPPPLAPSGWARMDHHHHAPRTALIPPALPRHPNQPHMIGRSQLVLGDDLWGTIRRRPGAPFMPPAQLPPLALGSPPPLMAVPPMVLPPGNIQEKLAQDRLTAFLNGENSGTYRPRSILSCPESPLYESLVSTFSTVEDEINFVESDVDHEYQQIPVIEVPPNRKQQPLPQESARGPSSTSTASPSSRSKSNNGSPEVEAEYQTVNDAKITTLDVRPEKNAGKEKDIEVTPETQTCSCQSSGRSPMGSSPTGKSPDSSKGSVPSPVNKKIDSSSQTVSPSGDYRRNAIYQRDSGKSPEEDVASTLSDSDTYQELDRPPTVIYFPCSTKETSGKAISTSKNEENVPESSSPKQIQEAKPKVSSASSLSHSKGGSSPSSGKSSSQSSQSRLQKSLLKSSPETTYLPLTIVLPETKDNPRKPEQSCKRNKDPSLQGPHIITTLDPPVKPNKNNIPDWSSESSEIPPLVVDFDSESEDSEGDLVALDFSSSTTTLEDDQSATIYVTGEEDDTTSLYSSIAELYSVIPGGENDSLVYVYRAVPHHHGNHSGHRHPPSIGYQIPAYILNRSDDCSSCGSSQESWSDTISFVEPTYRPSANLSVGSRGHLKIDYSWSWDSLDDFVRTTSPKGGSSSEERGTPRRYYVYSTRSPPTGRHSGDRKVSQRSHHISGAPPSSITNLGVLLSPWEKYSDPVAG